MRFPPFFGRRIRYIRLDMTPIALTDEQLDAIFRAARPLAPRERDPFLRDVATALQDTPAPGDGDIHRAIRVAQRRHFDPPLDDTAARAPRHRVAKPAA
jgi:hypothetical protein